MAAPIKVQRQKNPNIFQQANVKLRKNDFDAIIFNKGYDVFHDKFIKCPCQELKGANLPNCENCGGSGYVLVERVETRMVLQSMNLDTRYKEWSEEKLGMVKISALEKDILSHMDRIIARRGVTISNEVLHPKLFKGNFFAPTIYQIIEPLKIFLFQGPKEKLKPLTQETDFTFGKEEDKIIFSDEIRRLHDQKRQSVISIRYLHRPQFHVIDLVRDLMNSDIDSLETKLNINVPFPIHAVGRRSHYVLDKQNFNEDFIKDNTDHNQIIEDSRKKEI